MALVTLYPYTFEAAESVLRGARSRGRGRPLQNNTRLVDCTAFDRVTHEPVAAIGVLLHSTIVVAYLPNGEIVLNSGGWRTVTTQDRISGHSPARVHSDYGYDVNGGKTTYTSWRVSTSPLGTTPVKLKKCRTCKGTGYRSYQRWWGLEKPVTESTPCYRCHETGQADYGSKRILPAFEDGVIVNALGEVVGYGPPPRTGYPLRSSFDAVVREVAPRLHWTSDSPPDTVPVEYSHDAMTWKPGVNDLADKVAAEAEAEMREWADLLHR